MAAPPRRRGPPHGATGAVGRRTGSDRRVPDGAHQHLDRSDRAVHEDADAAAVSAGRRGAARHRDRAGRDGGVAVHPPYSTRDPARRRRRRHRRSRDAVVDRLAQSGRATHAHRPPVEFVHRDRLPVDRVSRRARGRDDRRIADDDGALAQGRLGGGGGDGGRSSDHGNAGTGEHSGHPRRGECRRLGGARGVRVTAAAPWLGHAARRTGRCRIRGGRSGR